MRVLVTGASGFVGGRLASALVERGHEVRAMTRHPERYSGAGKPVAGDVGDEESLRAALADVDAAYYLVHSLGDPDFERKDAAAARAFARAAADTGVGRIVYLGGLGKDEDSLSPHLRSRRQVERLLGETGVPVTALRAGIVVGHGGVSWEMTRQLVAHLPVMITPRWVHTRTQPIAIADMVRYLVGVLETPGTEGRVFEVGGAEVLEYLEMLTRVAEIQGRHMFVLPVPLLSPQLSSRWLSLVTDVDVKTGRSLVDSMTNEVVVQDDAIRSVVPFEPMDYDAMVLAALAERARERRERRTVQRRRGHLARGARA
ncbi:NAD(P)H-binding protein [Geodermatophilus sp. SYSU D00758]